MTTLLEAAAKDASEIVDALLKAGADPNERSELGQTGLMLAVNFDRTFQLLLGGGADPNLQDKSGKSALTYAANKGALRNVLKLLELGARVDSSSVGLLLAAMSAPKDSDAISLKILEAGGPPSGLYDGMPALVMSIFMKRRAITEALLKGGADPNRGCGAEANYMTPLIAAISSGDLESTRMLLNGGADPNLGHELVTPLALAMNGNRNDALQLLLASGARFTKSALILLKPGDQGGSDVTSELAKQYSKMEPAQSLAMILLEAEANLVGQVVIRNHVGVRRRLDEEARARGRCIEEIARAVAKTTEYYEDSPEAKALAELVLSRIRYRQLAELGKLTASDSNVRTGDGPGYEEACRLDLVGNGYVVHKTPPSGDQGADLLVTKGGITYCVQCKNYAGSVGNAAVQEAISAKQYYKTDHAVVVSDGTYTSSARELAAKTAVLLCKRDSIRNIDIVCASIA